MPQIFNILLSFVFASVTTFPAMAADNSQHRDLEKARQKFTDAIKALPAEATVADLIKAVQPIMTKQGQADFQSWSDKYGKEKAPQLSFNDNVMTVTHDG